MNTHKTYTTSDDEIQELKQLLKLFSGKWKYYLVVLIFLTISAFVYDQCRPSDRIVKVQATLFGTGASVLDVYNNPKDIHSYAAPINLEYEATWFKSEEVLNRLRNLYPQYFLNGPISLKVDVVSKQNNTLSISISSDEIEQSEKILKSMLIDYEQQRQENQRKLIMGSIKNLDEKLHLLKLELNKLATIKKQTTGDANALIVGRLIEEKLDRYLATLSLREQLTESNSNEDKMIIKSSFKTIEYPTLLQRLHPFVLALLLSFLMPTLFIYLQDMLNPKVRSVDDIKKLGIKLLGEVPCLFNKRNNVKIVRREVDNSLLEVFRFIRTNFIFHCKGTGKSTIFTSFEENKESSTCIMINLARSLALLGKKVLCVDGDARNSTLSKLLGDPEAGLLQSLGEDVVWNQVLIKDDDFSQLDYLPIGKKDYFHTETLASDNKILQCKEWCRDYDYVFIDAPSCDRLADLLMWTETSNNTVIVVKSGSTEKERLRLLSDMLCEGRGVDIISVVEKDNL